MFWNVMIGPNGLDRAMRLRAAASGDLGGADGDTPCGRRRT